MDTDNSRVNRAFPAMAVLSVLLGIAGTVPAVSAAREMMDLAPLFEFPPEFRLPGWTLAGCVIPLTALWTGLIGIRQSRSGGPMWAQIMVVAAASLGAIQTLFYLFTLLAVSVI